MNRRLGAKMNAIPWFAELKDLSSAETFLLVVMIMVGAIAAGFVIEIIARPLGFGTFINAILVLIGVGGGIYLRYHLLPAFPGNDAIVTFAAAAGAAFVLICFFFYAKSRLI
jgi:hypothetical protein